MTTNANGGSVRWRGAVVRLAVMVALVGGYAAWWLPRQGEAGPPIVTVTRTPTPDPTASLVAGCSRVLIGAPGPTGATPRLILEVEDADTEPGANVRLAVDAGSAHQRWWRCPTDGGYALLRALHAPTLCMTESAPKDFADVETRPCEAAASQQWTPHGTGPDDLGRDYWALTNRADRRVLDLHNDNFSPGIPARVDGERAVTRRLWDQLILIQPA